METTSVIALRSAQQDAPPPAGAEPPPQFAELTGAYWLEPIDGLAQEQDQQGCTVPEAHQRQWQIMALEREEATSGDGGGRRTPSDITG